MAKQRNNAQPADLTGATVGYEAELWPIGAALRASMDPAHYKYAGAEESLFRLSRSLHGADASRRHR